MNVTFAVVSNKLQSLLGLDVILKMNLITVNGEQFISKSKIQPKTLPCSKLPLAIKDRVKAELYSLIDRGILIPLTHTYEMGK